MTRKILHADDVREIRRLRSEGISIAKVAKIYGCSDGVIQKAAPGYGPRRPTEKDTLMAWLVGEVYYSDYDGFLERHGLD